MDWPSVWWKMKNPQWMVSLVFWGGGGGLRGQNVNWTLNKLIWAKGRASTFGESTLGLAKTDNSWPFLEIRTNPDN